MSGEQKTDHHGPSSGAREGSEGDFTDLMFDAVENPDPELRKMLDELENHPAFLSAEDLKDPTKRTTALDALEALIDDGTPEDDARDYKEDGNNNFKSKNYRQAIKDYTEGIKLRCSDRELNAILYSNRAVAQFYLQNNRSAFNDCLVARKFKTDHMKAILKGVQCCLLIKKPETAIKWCDDGLAFDATNEKLLQYRKEAEKLKRIVQRDRRKAEAEERKSKSAEENLILAIKDRGIILEKDERGVTQEDLLASLEPVVPGCNKVHLKPDGTLVWPLVLMYPEHQETDVISSCEESATFGEQLGIMFGPNSTPPPWDPQRIYNIDTIEIYAENPEKKLLLRVPHSQTLRKLLSNKKCSMTICCGTPTLFILSRASPFRDNFLKKYQ